MSAYSDLILAESSLLSYWRLNEAVGSGTVADSEGGITGTLAANVTLGEPSLIASDPSDTGALITTTNPSNITCGDNYPFIGTANFTLEAWIKPDAAALTNNGFILFKLDTTTDGWTFRVLASGAVRVSRIATSVTEQAQSAAGVITAGSTYHAVATYDGADLFVYVNGVEVVTGASTQSLVDTAALLSIGGTSAGGTRLSGNVDEVAIYNDNLSAASILEHYELGARPIPRFDYSKFPKSMMRPAVPVPY